MACRTAAALAAAAGEAVLELYRSLRSAWCAGALRAPSPRWRRGKRAAASQPSSGSSQPECGRLGSVEGTSHTTEGACGFRTSCLGCFMPPRKTTPDGSHADARHSTSDRRRCDRRECQLVTVSLSAFPIERQAWSRISSSSWPQARRSRAIGHGLRSLYAGGAGRGATTELPCRSHSDNAEIRLKIGRIFF